MRPFIRQGIVENMVVVMVGYGSEISNEKVLIG